MKWFVKLRSYENQSLTLNSTITYYSSHSHSSYLPNAYCIYHTKYLLTLDIFKISLDVYIHLKRMMSWQIVKVNMNLCECSEPIRNISIICGFWLMTPSPPTFMKHNMKSNDPPCNPDVKIHDHSLNPNQKIRNSPL